MRDMIAKEKNNNKKCVFQRYKAYGTLLLKRKEALKKREGKE